MIWQREKEEEHRRQATALAEERRKAREEAQAWSLAVKGDSDDEREEWEELDETPDFRRTDWIEKVDRAKPNVEEDFDIQEIKKLRVELEELRKMMKKDPVEDGKKPDGDEGDTGAPDVGDD